MLKFLAESGPFVSALFSAGGVATWVLAWREKKAAANLQSGNALDIMQKVYAQFVSDTALEIGQLKEEVKMLRSIVEEYKKTCDNCPHKTR